MSNIKTAISIQASLLERAERLANKLNVSRSRLVALALEDYIKRQENRELLARINAAYADDPDAAEEALVRRQRHAQRRIVEGEW